MIYCGSGSYIGKVLVLVPVPVPVMVTVPDPDLFAQFFNNKIFVQNLAISALGLEASLFPRKFASNFLFLTFV